MYITMSNNKWKQFGGTTKSYKTFSIGNIVADDVLLRQKYSGEFEILGSIVISDNMISSGVDVAKTSSGKRTNLMQLTSGRNSTNDELHIFTPTKFGNNGTSISDDFFIGSGAGIGVNTIPDISGATLHIYGRPETTNIRNHDLIISSAQTTSSTVLTQNSLLSGGIRAKTDASGSALEFYNNSINDNMNQPAAAITYDKKLNSLRFATEGFSFGDTNQKRAFRYAYDTRGTNYDVFNGTSLTCKSEKNGNSNTFLDITSSSGNGLALAGGAFPLDTTNEGFGLFGIRQQIGNVLNPVNMAFTTISNKPVSPANHTPIKRVRMGVNNYNPNKDYTLSVNGKMKIENGEVNEIAFINVDPVRIVYDFHPNSNYTTKYFSGSNTGIPATTADSQSNYKLFENTNNGIGDWTSREIPVNLFNRTLAISSNTYYKTSASSDPDKKFRVMASGNNTFYYENSDGINGINFLSATDNTNRQNLTLGHNKSVTSPYFKAGTLTNDGTFSDFKYVESFMRAPDTATNDNSNTEGAEYLIILLQEDNGLTYMVDFGRTPSFAEVNNNLSGAPFIGTRAYGRSAFSTGLAFEDFNLLEGNSITAGITITYSDLSYSIVEIDTLNNVTMNQTVYADNDGQGGLFILGSKLDSNSSETFGFKHFKNTIASISNPNPLTNSFTNVIASTFGQNSKITPIDDTREYYNMYICKDDRNYMVAVGDNVITYITDGGTDWSSINANTILGTLQPNNASPKLRGLEIADDGSEIFIVGDGTIMYNLDGSSNFTNLNSWKTIPYDILNVNGAGDALTSANSKLIDIHKIDQDNYVVTRDLQDYDYSNSREGQISTIHIYIPSLFNRPSNDVLDICGNVLISGDLNFEYTSKLSSSSNKITVATQTNFIIEDALGVNVSDVTAGYNVDISGNIQQSGVMHQF
jgi:hypothetical protein